MQPWLLIPPLDAEQNPQQSLLRSAGTFYFLGHYISFHGSREL